MNQHAEYNGWPIFHTMPDGWKIDHTCGSPLAKHVFITNGKSVMNAQKRALLRVNLLDVGIQSLAPAERNPVDGAAQKKRA